MSEEVAGPPSQRLAELGLTLPPVATPLAAYVPAVSSAGQVYTSGQLPTVGGRLLATGKVRVCVRVGSRIVVKERTLSRGQRTKTATGRIVIVTVATLESAVPSLAL